MKTTYLYIIYTSYYFMVCSTDSILRRNAFMQNVAIRYYLSILNNKRVWQILVVICTKLYIILLSSIITLYDIHNAKCPYLFLLFINRIYVWKVIVIRWFSTENLIVCFRSDVIVIRIYYFVNDSGVEH